MRRFARSLAIATLIAAAAAVPARAQDPQALPDAPATLTLTVRVTPANLWKVASDLRQLMKDGGQSAQPLLNDLLGVISAEMAIERGPRPAPSSSGVRASSDPLTRAIQKGGVEAASKQWLDERAAIGSQAAASGLSLGEAYANVLKAVGQHTKAARIGYDTIAGALSESKPPKK